MPCSGCLVPLYCNSFRSYEPNDLGVADRRVRTSGAYSIGSGSRLHRGGRDPRIRSSISHYTHRMSVRRRITLLAFALLLPLSATACTVTGPGTTSECTVSGCTVTFDRGVNAKASVLGIDAELVAVNGNIVTLRIGGQEVTVPAGESQPAQGMDVRVSEVTDEKVVVVLSTGLNQN